MRKRSKTDDSIDLGTGEGRVLVVNDDQDACELVARLVHSAGWPADQLYDLDALDEQLAHARYVGVIIDSLSMGITEAFGGLEKVRANEASDDIAVILIAATDTNRLFAYQSGADGFVVRPVHADELLDAVRITLGRSNEDREEFRRSQLMGGATTV